MWPASMHTSHPAVAAFESDPANSTLLHTTETNTAQQHYRQSSYEGTHALLTELDHTPLHHSGHPFHAGAGHLRTKSARYNLYHLRVPSFSLTQGGSDLLHALDEPTQPDTNGTLEDPSMDLPLMHRASLGSQSVATSVASSALSTPNKHREVHQPPSEMLDSYGMQAAATTSAPSASSSARSSFNDTDGKGLLSHLSGSEKRTPRKSPLPLATPTGRSRSAMSADVEGHVVLKSGKHTFVLILRQGKTGKRYTNSARSPSPASTSDTVVHGYLCMREVQSKVLDALPQYRGRSEQSSRSSIRQELEKVSGTHLRLA